MHPQEPFPDRRDTPPADPFGPPTTVLPDSLLPGTWTEQPPPAGWPLQTAARTGYDGSGYAAEQPGSRGRHQAPLTGPGAVPASFTDQLLEPVVGWWRGLRRSAGATDRRTLLGAIVLVPAVAVLGVVGVVALLPDPAPSPAAATLTPSAAPPSAGPAPSTAAPAVGQLTALTADQTAALMGRTGLSLPGSPEQAWTFQDGNGLNLLVATSAPTAEGADSTLRVALFGGLDGDPVALARLTDTGLPGCTPRGNPDKGKRDNEKRPKKDRGDRGDRQQQDGPAPAPTPERVTTVGFTIDSVTLADHDQDGVGEVTIGWASSCDDPTSTPSDAQLALLTGKRSFLLHGEGVVGTGSGQSPVAEPSAGSWPQGSLEPTQELFHRLYF